MPHMKYFREVGMINDHYDSILREFTNHILGKGLLETWDIPFTEESKQLILEEKEVLKYILGCQLSITHTKNVKKPSIELVTRCFTRHIKFLESIYRIDKFTVNKYHRKSVVREYKACQHYLFKFSCQGWVDSLPEEILTFENKHPNFMKEDELPIPNHKE